MPPSKLTITITYIKISGDFYTSTLIIRDPRLRHSASGAVITVPLFLAIHCRKLKRDHNLAFNIMTEIIPELSSSFFIAISDNEFTEDLAKHFKRAFIAVDE